MSIGDQRNNMREMMDSVHSIMYILILAAFILSAVILYNLGILSCLERYREYATMKVIGFYNGEINALIIKESILHLEYRAFRSPRRLIGSFPTPAGVRRRAPRITPAVRCR